MRVYYQNGQLAKVRYTDRRVRQRLSQKHVVGTRLKFSKRGNVSVTVVKKPN